MAQVDGFLAAVGVLQHCRYRAARREFRQPYQAHPVVVLHPIPVGRVLKGKRQQALLFEVGFVDAGEAAGDDGGGAEHPGRQGSVFPAGTLAVVFIADGDPADALGVVGAGNLRDGHNLLAGELVFARAGVLGKGVVGAQEHIVAEVVQMPAEAQPGAGRGNGVGGRLALGFDQDGDVLKVAAIPGFPGFQHLEAAAGGVDAHFHIAAVGRRFHIHIGAGVKAGGRHFGGGRGRLEHKLVAGGVHQRVGERVEGQAPAQAHSDGNLRAGDEVHSAGVAIVAAGEVAVV